MVLKSLPLLLKERRRSENLTRLPVLCTRMSTANAPPTILSPLTADAVVHDTISLLPFSIAFDGPAPISSYFKPRPLTQEGQTHVSMSEPGDTVQSPKVTDHEEAAFRGRKLVSTRLDLPQAYRGIVYTTTRPVAVSASAQDTLNDASSHPAKRQKMSSSRGRAGTGQGPLFVDPAEEIERMKAVAIAAGLRRSPRKAAPSRMVEKAKRLAVQAKKFSLDSSDEEDDEKEDEAEQNRDQAQDEDVSSLAPAPESAERPALQRLETDATLVDPEPIQSQTEDEGPVTTKDEELEPRLERDAVHLKPVSTFTAIKVWQPDCAMSLDDDVYARALREWCGGLSAKVSSFTSASKLVCNQLTSVHCPRFMRIEKRVLSSDHPLCLLCDHHGVETGRHSVS